MTREGSPSATSAWPGRSTPELRVLVTGAAGQLGRALVARLGPEVAWAGGRDELDVRDGARVRERVAQTAPGVVINAAADNRVDLAETETDDALAVNALGALNLARAAVEVGALLVHVSTDYVFDGAQDHPYAEEDRARPLSAYGLSKRAGELAVSSSPGATLVVRTSGVFGRGGSRGKGGSFVERILERARGGAPLRVVDDQTFAPTYAPDLAEALVALARGGHRGLLHVVNAGECTWHGLAQAAVRMAGLPATVERIRTQDLGAAARRPRYSVLSTRRYGELGLPPLRPWEDALAEMLQGG
jgi:dTDP-4-dehydrorhamnose reductase